MRYRIEPYEPRHFGPALELMTKTRRRRRQACPALPPGLDDASTSRRILEGGISGSVAVTPKGGVAGFLFAERIEDPLWGNSVIAGVDRCTLPPGAGTAALAGLYAASFAPKTTAAPVHKVYCPAYDGAMLRNWFGLGFGMEQVYAWSPLAEMERDFATEGMAIRRAKKGDEDTLAGLSPLIALSQAEAPVWAGAPPTYLAGLREGFRELAADKRGYALLAFRGRKALGYQAWLPVAANPIDGPAEGAIELSVAGTVPDERGTGVGRALTSRGVVEALSRGYSVCFTDWRSANFLSSSFWTARGFRPYLYRLARRFDPAAVPTFHA